ncbi:MAG: homocysteine S-methyltransferase family protein [Bacteroides sp.]|nr:homocysteine S-methyltransferase family protein [Bacteroides sp.]
MNTDDSHNRSFIVKLDEGLFPDLFGNDGKGNISLSALNDKEYFDKKLGNIDCVDILGLPTERLNSFMLKSADCANINSAIAEAVKSSAASKNKKIAGVIGPSGIFTDPFSEISFTELISAYDTQVSALNNHAELYIINGASSMSDMRAALLSCKKTEKPVYVTIRPSACGSEETGGISALGGLITAQEMGADAFGIICADEDEYADTLRELARYAKIPLIADLSAQGTACWESALSLGIKIFSLEADNVLLIEKIRCGLAVYSAEQPLDDFFVFTHYENVFFLEADTTEISEPISCRPDMEEVISEACKTSCDVLRIEINSTDDAIDFARNAHMASLPVMFLSENVIALKMALLLYQGIALIDSSTLIPKAELETICKKYGAVVY